MNKGSIHLADCRPMSRPLDIQLYGAPIDPPDDICRGKREELIPLDKGLSDDHLTATYWG